jgi:LuxR family maltose regulon positive regulatory protein
VLALVYQSQNHPEKAREIADLMVSLCLEIRGTTGLFAARAFQAELALRQGRLAEASRWAEQTEVPFSLPTTYVYRPPLTLVRILLAQNTPQSREQARRALSQLYDYFTSLHYTSVIIEVLALQALLYQAEGREQIALEALRQSIALAEPGGFIRCFIDLGEPLQRLLAALTRERIPSPYETRILADFPLSISPMAARYRANAALPAPLTTRELEVLALLDKRYTDKEVAATLVISVETVHSHVRHLGEKLDAHGRQAIVEAARAQRLVE